MVWFGATGVVFFDAPPCAPVGVGKQQHEAPISACVMYAGMGFFVDVCMVFINKKGVLSKKFRGVFKDGNFRDARAPPWLRENDCPSCRYDKSKLRKTACFCHYQNYSLLLSISIYYFIFLVYDKKDKRI